MSFLQKNISFFKEQGFDLDDQLVATPEQLINWAAKLDISVDNLLKRDYSAKAAFLKNKTIRLLILDVDGVLTDGGMYYSEKNPGDEFKKFNAKDGIGIMQWTKTGGQIGIISSGKNINLIRRRAELLGIQYVYASRSPKLETLLDLCNQLGISIKEVAMIGDDINDKEVLGKVGLSACPNDAVPIIKNMVDIVLNRNGGKGCVREFIDQYLLTSRS